MTAPVSLPVMEQAGMVREYDARTRIGDEFRIVASRVLGGLEAAIEAGERAANLLMVTSTRPGEGKSFASLNLAATMAQYAQRPVLLVDADNKPGSIGKLLGLGDRAGLFEAAADDRVALQGLAVPTEIAGLSVMPIGDLRALPAPGQRARPLSAVVTALGAAFADHLVVLDAGPCLATSDPATLAPFVGQIVMVIEAERTQMREIEAAIELVRVCKRIVLLLNKTRSRTNASFGSYSNYGAYYLKQAPLLKAVL